MRVNEHTGWIFTSPGGSHMQTLLPESRTLFQTSLHVWRRGIINVRASTLISCLTQLSRDLHCFQYSTFVTLEQLHNITSGPWLPSQSVTLISVKLKLWYYKNRNSVWQNLKYNGSVSLLNIATAYLPNNWTGRSQRSTKKFHANIWCVLQPFSKKG